MKQFKNLPEVLAYQSTCPFCSKRMMPGLDMTYDENSVKAYLKFGDSQVTVDCNNNNILECREVSGINTLYTFQKTPTFQYIGSTMMGLSKSGVDMRRLLVSCEECSKYSYLVQVHLSLEQRKIVGLYLNSETASIEDGARLYEIKNIYATEKTEMSTFHTHLSNQHGALDKVEFPLVPLDLQNPMKTVERIKKLIVFL